MGPENPSFRDRDSKPYTMTPNRMQPIPLRTIGSIYRDEETNELFWNNPGLLIEESDKIGTLADIDDAMNNVKVIITKKALKGEL